MSQECLRAMRTRPDSCRRWKPSARSRAGPGPEPLDPCRPAATTSIASCQPLIERLFHESRHELNQSPGAVRTSNHSTCASKGARFTVSAGRSGTPSSSPSWETSAESRGCPANLHECEVASAATAFLLIASSRIRFFPSGFSKGIAFEDWTDQVMRQRGTTWLGPWVAGAR